MTSALSISGEFQRGEDVRTQNVMAVLALSNIVKSSLGPVGLDKMLVDEIGDVIVTNDGATILKQLDVKHPAARVLVDLSNLQDQEVGDGTTSVVVLAAELLKQANKLVRQKVHPTCIIAGFQQARRLACKFLAKKMAKKVAELGDDCIMSAARTSMSSKVIGLESEFFAQMAVSAVKAVKVENKGNVKKPFRYPLSSISILKAHGRSIKESELVDGLALNCVRAAQGMPTYVKNAKIALLDIDLRKTKLAMGVQVIVNDPTQLEKVRKKEADMTRDRIHKLLEAGANVVLTTKGIDDMAMKEFIQNGVMAVRRCLKPDLHQIARATGGRIIVNMGDDEGEESVDPEDLGSCEMVSEEKVGDGELIYFRGCSNSRAQTIVLRGANDFMLDEVERALHDSLCVVKRVLESKSVVPGGGCCEVALNVALEQEAEEMKVRDQLAVSAYAQALLVIPSVLAVNGAFDATELTAQLRSRHTKAQEEGKECHYGLDLLEGDVIDNLEKGVLEPTMSKIKMLRFATEAAVTILRIDDSITMQAANNPQGAVPNQY